MTPKSKGIITSAVAGMSLEQLQCRDFGHAWRGYTAKSLPRRQFESILQCRRCFTLRVRILSDTGEVLKSHYRYEPGYLIEGAGRLTARDRGAIRLAAMMAEMNDPALTG